MEIEVALMILTPGLAIVTLVKLLVQMSGGQIFLSGLSTLLFVSAGFVALFSNAVSPSNVITAYVLLVNAGYVSTAALVVWITRQRRANL